MTGRKPGVWLRLLDAALDQPNPSPALKAALADILALSNPRSVDTLRINQVLRKIVAPL